MRYYLGSFWLALLQGVGPGDSRLLWLIVGIGVGLVIGGLISLTLRKSKSKREKPRQAQPPQLNTSQPFQSPARRAPSHARRCPVCNSTYTDEALIYCVSDGASLVPVINPSPPRTPEATILYPEAGNRDLPPTVPSRPDESQR